MSRINALLSAGVLIGLVACRDADPTGILEPTSEVQFAIVSGNDQQAPVTYFGGRDIEQHGPYVLWRAESVSSAHRHGGKPW